MRRTTLFIITLLILSCSKYEYKSDTKRFNSRTGETEYLSDIGEWKSVRIIKIEQEEERKRIEEEKRLRTLKRDIGIYNLDWGLNDSDKEIKYIMNVRENYLSDYVNMEIENNSRWEIERLISDFSFYNEIDSTLISTKRDTLLLDIDSDKGKPFSGSDIYRVYHPIPPEDQYYKWNLIISGWLPDKD
tara:strand:+ start:246 stop:809 length:564 start_codon:yes stop_codon:yes gene_type:complete